MCENNSYSSTAKTTIAVTGIPDAADEDSAIVVVKNRGRVLGAATIVTGPKDIALWVSFIAFIGSIGIYAHSSRGRLENITPRLAYADMRLRFTLWAIRRKEKRPDTKFM
ncbi:MAG: hypothetical protein A2939_01340 [Parcubacteria group bacterium RIFCSPLOWO2_01_FULL_48_18]|nr:MAG: hypothetical protein A2939_01340 [Parcubacteria group bacterium RIFCSPLOWO2_01_FULL_48_18]OHB23870.1 MAG: hypothetical protein A3J67_03245 [Parcubacteria group bacterium RIFCSPHIGHO2_02_FULL_48_10b]